MGIGQQRVAGVVSNGVSYAALGSNVAIGADSTFTREGFTGDTSVWMADTSDYLGMRFHDESSASILYGWLHLTTTALLGFRRPSKAGVMRVAVRPS